MLATGILTGFSVIIFNNGIHAIHDFSWEGVPLAGGDVIRNMEFDDPSLSWTILVTPMLGGLGVSGLRWLAGGLNTVPETVRGDDLKARVERLRNAFRPVLKAVAAMVTLGTGASLGPEGPSVEIGKSVSQSLQGLLRGNLSDTKRTALLAAGAAAGVGAGFNAAISGVFFAIENVLQKEQQRKLKLRRRVDESSGSDDEATEEEETTIVLVLLAAVTAAAVVQAGLGSEPAFRVPTFNLRSPLELPLYLVLGSLCGVVAGSFSFGCTLTSSFYNQLVDRGLPRWMLPAVGGLLTGIIALRYPEVLYEGFENVNEIIRATPTVTTVVPEGTAPPFQYGPELLLELTLVKVQAKGAASAAPGFPPAAG